MTFFKLLMIMWLAWVLISGTVDLIEYYRNWSDREKVKKENREREKQAEQEYIKREEKHRLFYENEREINNGKR